MRIEDKEFDVAFDVIEGDAEDGVRQDAAADHHRRAFRPEMLHQLPRLGRQVGAGTHAHEPRCDADEMIEAITHLQKKEDENGLRGRTIKETKLMSYDIFHLTYKQTSTDLHGTNPFSRTNEGLGFVIEVDEGLLNLGVRRRGGMGIALKAEPRHDRLQRTIRATPSIVGRTILLVGRGIRE